MQLLKLPFFERALRGLMASICQLIYPLIAWLYNLFMNISRVKILSEGAVAPIYQRVTILLTVIMVFYVTFQFVKYIVQPDEITNKEKGVGNIIYKMIAVVVLIAFVPTIFEGAFWLQSKIINNDLIGKVILGTANNDAKNFGQEFSANIFGMFYKFEVDEERGIEEDEECGGAECRMIVNMNLQFLREQGSLKYLSVGLNDSKDVKTAVKGKEEEMALITFDFFMAVLVGAVVAWMLLLYCVDAGTRWAQLVFLQIIAPIPIIGYLSPKKDGIFQKWVRQCFTTYLDLFIRMVILYFILLVCQILTNSLSSGELFEGLDGLSDWMKNVIYIALVLGLMLFAKKAPKMLSELFPSTGAASGTFGLSGKDRFSVVSDAYKTAKGFIGGAGKAIRPFGRVAGFASGAAIGAAAGLATGIGQGIRKKNSAKTAGGKVAAGTFGGIWGGIRGTVGGAVRGAVNGGKKGNMLKNSVEGAKKQIQANKRFGNIQENGYTLGHRIGDNVKSAVGAKSRIEVEEEKKSSIKREADARSKIKKFNDDIRDRAEKKLREGKGPGDTAQRFISAEQRVKDLQENAEVKSKYTVSKYKTDAEATDAYNDAVRMARMSVNKQNYYDASGNFDQLGYDYACQLAAKQIDKNDYKVGAYATEKEAQDAYEQALADAIKDLKAVKDDAINQYINNGADPAIDSMRTTFSKELEEYNRYASEGRTIDVSKIPTDAKDFDDYVKVDNKGIEDELAREVIGIDAKIDSIKREIDGSGFGEKKN